MDVHNTLLAIKIFLVICFREINFPSQAYFIASVWHPPSVWEFQLRITIQINWIPFYFINAWILSIHYLHEATWFLRPAYVVRREVMFSEASVCLSTSGEITPSPSHNTSTDPMSFLGYPSNWLHVPSQGQYPSPRWGYPSPRQGVPQSWLGDRLCLDRLCRGRYAPCSFPQGDFLVWKWVCQCF